MDSTAAAAPVDIDTVFLVKSILVITQQTILLPIKTDFDLVCKVHFAASAEYPHLVRKTKSAP